MNIVDQLLKISLLGSAWVLYLLLILSFFTISVMVERLIFFVRGGRGGGEALRADLLRALEQNDVEAAERTLRASRSFEGDIVAEALVFRDGGHVAFGEALQSELARSRKQLERGLNFLGTVGNNAPFIGLFGTVIGVIIAFHELGSASARAGAMGSVMSGIAEALVATGVGLFVAIPAVVGYNLTQKRIAGIEDDANTLGRLISAWLETRARGASLHLPAAPVGK